MSRAKGIPAAAFMASYSSPPGSPYNAAPITPLAYANPIVEIDGDVAAALNAGEDRYRQRVLGQAPINRSDDAITEAFDKARETIAELEAKWTEAVCPAWSVAQHAKRAS